MTPLYGHTSPETAFEVTDYPYGFRLRTSIRYWLETKKDKGTRFVGQTLNPKTDQWNKPKAGSYIRIVGGMYLDENNHVHFTGVHEYTKPEDALKFAQTFTELDLSDLRVWAAMKVRWYEKYASGQVYMTINGEKRELSEADKAKAVVDRDAWMEVSKALNK